MYKRQECICQWSGWKIAAYGILPVSQRRSVLRRHLPKDVATYDLKPEMSAPEVGMDLVEAIKSDKYDVIIINFANPDMVGPVSYTHLDVYKRQLLVQHTEHTSPRWVLQNMLTQQ